MSGLTINALCAGYGKRRIIEHLSISTLPRGEVTVLLGPNGCGNQRYCAPSRAKSRQCEPG